MVRRSLLVLLPLAALGCQPAIGEASSPLVYGVDDRRDYYQLTDPAQIALADATVVLVNPSELTAAGDGYDLDTSVSFGTAYSLCASEPFRTQPMVGFCSGFQVASDLVVTAGHCIRKSAECANTRLVFGFRMDGPSTSRAHVPASDVYGCSQIVGRLETGNSDWAVVRVDRPIVGHTPLAVRRSGRVSDGAPLVVAGHPAGIPIKVAGGATVRNNLPANYFESNLDVYAGNSGSPVVDPAGTVEGILVRGNPDWVRDKTGRCYRSNVCADTGCPGWEGVTRATVWAQLVP